MNIPKLTTPENYAGLYIFDFGEWSACGYTAEEIATLLESEQYRDGKVYRIHRASADGTLEIAGVSTERFKVESGMMFYRADAGGAKRDWFDLLDVAENNPPPNRCMIRLVDRGEPHTDARYAVALIYPAEYEPEMGDWLGKSGYAGGDFVEGGPSAVTAFYQDDHQVLDRKQLWSSATQSRSREEVLENVRQAVQR
ncbi:MAG: hypothetical protein AB7N71_04350 [Phycisphaerae bacterium]